jgi:hypothetical protein
VKELEDANDVLSAKLALAEGGTVEYEVATTMPSVTYEDLQAEVKRLNKENDELEEHCNAVALKVDHWRDLYQAASGHQETGLEYKNWKT